MKPVLVFLGLVSVGLFVLIQLQKRLDPAPFQSAFAEVEASDADGDLPREPLVLGGELIHTNHKENFEVRAADSRTFAGGKSVFYDFRAVIRDGVDNRERAIIHASESSVQLMSERMTNLTAIENTVVSETMHMVEVTISWLEGAVVAPLELSVPTLVGNLRQRDFSSEDHAVARGQGLFAEGDGLRIDFDDGIVRFDDNAVLELSDGERGSGSIRGGKSLHLLPGSERLGGGFEAVARGGAILDWVGASRVEIQADRIQIQARESAAGLRLDSLVANGAVTVTTDLGVFEAGRAEVAHTRDRDGFEVKLEDQPRASVQLAHRGESLPAEIEGAGPLLVRMRTEDTFELAGPATTTWEAGKLVSEGGLRGWTTDGRTGLVLSGWNGVALEVPDGELSTEALEVAFAQDGDQAVVQVTTDGSSELAGTSSEGHAYEMSSQERLLYEQRGKKWTLPVATGVRLRVDGPDSSSVEAEHIANFDPEAGVFEARGNVVLRHGLVAVRAQLVKALARDHFEAEGRAGAPAIVDRPDGFVSAARVEILPTGLFAEGGAKGEFTRDPFVLTASADGLTLQEGSPDATGAGTVFDLVALGAAELVLIEGDRGYDIAGGSIHARQALVGDDLSTLQLNATRDVLLRTRRVGESYELRCDTLDVTSEPMRAIAADAGEAAGVAWSVEAHGSVDIRGESSAPFHGSSEHLVVRPDETLRLAGEPGQRLRFEGLLPGAGYPYVLVAPSAVISGDRLEADDPEIWLREFNPLNTDTETTGELFARADHLSCTREEFSLSGDVRMEGVDERDIPWTLDSTFLRFGGGALTSTVGPPRFASMQAWAGFRLEFGENLLADGQRLEVNTSSGVLQITGTPARVDYGVHRYESEFLEYDLYLRIIVRAAHGTLRPRGTPIVWPAEIADRP